MQIQCRSRREEQTDDEFSPWTQPADSFTIAEDRDSWIEYKCADDGSGLRARFKDSGSGEWGQWVHGGKFNTNTYLRLAGNNWLTVFQFRPAEEVAENSLTAMADPDAVEPNPLSDYQRGVEVGYELGWKHATEKFQASTRGLL